MDNLLTSLDVSDEAIERLRAPIARIANVADEAVTSAMASEGLTESEKDFAVLVLATKAVKAASDYLDLDPVAGFEAVSEAIDEGLFEFTDDEAKDAGLI